MAGINLNWTPARLPAPVYPTQERIDYSPLNEGIDALAKSRDIEARRAAGAKIAAGDTSGGVNALYELGNFNEAAGVQNAISQQKRNASQDQALLVNRAGGLAQIGMKETDPARKSAILNRIYSLDPKMRDSIAAGGVDISNPDNVFQHVQSEAAGYKGYQDPTDIESKRLGLEKDRAQIGLINAQSAAAARKGDNSYAERAAAAQSFGLDPNSDAGRAYILTGKLPREDQSPLTATDKKAILEADESVGTNRAALEAIAAAKKLSPQANSGWFANTRAQIGANLPDLAVPDFISSPESSKATIDFDNAVVGQALTQLKAIFGGNPTEGERTILLDLQGSSGKPANVRNEILARAERAAQNRLRLNEQRANELRGGTFYKPGGGTAAVNPQNFHSNSDLANSALSDARAAISNGAPRDAVIQRLRENGIDPSGL